MVPAEKAEPVVASAGEMLFSVLDQIQVFSEKSDFGCDQNDQH